MTGQPPAGWSTCSVGVVLSRRRFLAAAFGSVALVANSSACGSRSKGEAASSPPTDDYSARFARYQAANEPNGDPAKVVWPDFVTKAGPDVQRLYEFQITHGDLMRYMPCFCGCGQSAGHRSNRDCYVKTVNPDGSVVLDSMAPT
jgi:Protein of unknown function with PCYCGC motif